MRVRRSFPFISRATVYNTLNLFVEKGLLQPLVLAEGKVVFDPEDRAATTTSSTSGPGSIHDIPWSALEVRHVQDLRGYEVDTYQVVLRGRRRGGRPSLESAHPRAFFFAADLDTI